MKTKTTSLFVLLCGIIFAQVNPESVYKNLERKKFYAVATSARTTNGITKYFIGNKETDEKAYEKFQKNSWENMSGCRPCILQFLDINDSLLSEGVQCTDCRVGWFKEYFPGGQIKLSAWYKENPTGDWNDLWYRGYCSIPNGEWTFFSAAGDTLYKEYWDNGKFVKQIPELDSNEVWNVIAVLNGKELPKENASVKSKDIHKVILTPQYKNSKPVGKEVEIKFEISAIGKVPLVKSFTLENFSSIEPEKLMKEGGLRTKDKPNFYLHIYNRKKLIADYYFKIKF